MKTFDGKWLPNLQQTRQQEFEKTCLELVNNDLKDFKRHPQYIRIIANDVRDENTAKMFYAYLKSNYPELLNKYNLAFFRNDKIGNPNIFTIKSTNVSPGTLRFIKVVGDVNRIDKDINKIIEIGAGYGGQCLIFKVNNPKIDYTIIDIPSSLKVSKLYLDKNNIEHKSIQSNNIELEEAYDLCISDYCLSEFDEKGVQFYLYTVLRKCKYAYITSNSLGMKLPDFLKLLNTVFNDISIMLEYPKTSEHTNFIIICKGNLFL